MLLREWFLVPLAGNYLGHTDASRPLAVGAILVAAAMAAIAIRLRDRLLIAVAVVQAALVASMLQNMDAHHAAVNCVPAGRVRAAGAAAIRGAPAGARAPRRCPRSSPPRS